MKTRSSQPPRPAGSAAETSPPATIPEIAPSPIPLTAQQRQAIEERGVSIALSAGAGCGKTFVLTRRFLSDLEPGPNAIDFSQLVAITFTERAAREMRERIRKECRRRLDEAPPGEVDAWLTIVRQLDAARVSTIHSFCGSLLRMHAVEAGLDPRFKLLDETTSGSLLRRAVREGLHALLAGQDVDSHDLVVEFGMERVRSLLESLVLERYRIEFSAWRDKSAEELSAAWERLWRDEVAPQLLQRFLESATVQRVTEILREQVPDHPVMQERRLALLEALEELPLSSSPEAVLETILSQARVQGGGSAKVWSSPDVYDVIKTSFEALRKQVDRLLEQWRYAAEDLLPAAEMGMRLLRVLEQVGGTYDEQKRASGWLDFDDLLLGARNLLRDHDHVRRQVSSGIRLLLVDEFQDTDPIQSDLVKLLCGKALLNGKLFVVGDVKQSIYRFRRAEPQVFRKLRESIPPEGRLPLTMNFRSQPAILSFVNALFEGALGDTYEPLQPSCRQISPEPCIEFLWATGASEAPVDSADEGDVATGRESVEIRRRREADWIARRLKQLVEDQEPRVRYRDSATGADSLRRLELKDIVILFRAMTDVRHYEAALRERGLDYYVVGGGAFFAQQEVFDVVNLCRTLDDPDDEVALVGVLRSPFFSLSDDALLALARQGGEGEANSPDRATLFETLVQSVEEVGKGPLCALSNEQRQRVSFAGQVLGDLHNRKDRLPLATLLTQAIERTGYDAALLTEFLGVRKLANLRKLIDQARSFDQTGLFTLADFVDRLQESVGEEIRESLAATHPESSNVIRLMSIHQSKGLEFPLVVIADMDRQGQERTPAARLDPVLGPLVALPEKFGQKRENLGLKLLRLQEQEESLAETRRLLYVATTRAADHLILSANLKNPGEVSHPWMALLAERFDLLTGQPRPETLARHGAKLPDVRVHHAAPDVPPEPPGARRGGLPLSQFRALLESADAAPLPASLQPLPTFVPVHARLSVSEIRQRDAQRHQRTPLVLDESDEARSPLDDPDEESLVIKGSAARLLGDIVHLVLERVELARPGDVPQLVARASAGFANVSPEVTREAVACVETFFGSPLAAEMAGARHCAREIEFCLPWTLKSAAAGERGAPPRVRTITGKLDVLLQGADGNWSVVDYKTGRLPPGNGPQAMLLDYEMQLAIYALAVERLTGTFPVRAELVLLRDEARRVGFDPLQADWTLLKDRIDRALEEFPPNAAFSPARGA
ncbi:MAG: UvrD-helicase domain-containing protein [Planctomycetales bacterium]